MCNKCGCGQAEDKETCPKCGNPVDECTCEDSKEGKEE